MLSEKKIIVLQLPGTRTQTSNNSARIFSSKRLRLYVRFLLLLGYQFKTITEAVAAPSGKICCLTFDAADTQAKDIIPMVVEWRLPGTVLLATNEIDSPVFGAGLTWKKLRRLVKRKWEVGTFGQQYEDLTKMPHKAQLDHIRDAKLLIHERLGFQPSVFAYPYGAYDTSVLKILKDLGFRSGLSSHKGINKDKYSCWQLQNLRLTGKLSQDLLDILRLQLRKRPKINVPLLASRRRTSTQRSTA